MATTSRQYRAAQRARVAPCRRYAEARGLRHTTMVLEIIGEFAGISEALPYPSQETMARRCGVHVRTVRRWLAKLEHVGAITVYRARARRVGGGQYTRQTNRYRLNDVAARQAPEVWPVPRRRRKSPAFSPRGHQCPQTLLGLNLDGVSAHRGAAQTPAETVPRVVVEPESVELLPDRPVVDVDPATARQRFAEIRAKLKR